MQGSFQGSGWQRWLEVSAAVEDCKLASHARRATLNLQSARTVATAEVLAVFGHLFVGSAPCRLVAAAWACTCHSLHQGAGSEGMSCITQAERFAMPNSAGSANSGAPGLQGRRLVMRDNVHLFDPGSEQHEVLATEGTASTSPGNLPISWFCIILHVILLCNYNVLSSRICQLIPFARAYWSPSGSEVATCPREDARGTWMTMRDVCGIFGAATMMFSHSSTILVPISANVVKFSCTNVVHAGAPDIDIVFVHGIRGGPFVTWRRVRTPKTLDPSTGNLQMAVPDMRHELCWPIVWLKADVPGARLLSLEYAAPASGWEVGCPLTSGTWQCSSCSRSNAGYRAA